MREIINLLEAAGTVTLYRGDSTEIERFQLEKTDDGALFGIGIYLTNDAEVAKDYTVKASGDDVIFPPREMRREGGFTDLKELTAAFIRHLVNDGEYGPQLASLKDKWQTKYYEMNGKIDWSGDHQKAQQERERIQQELNDGFKAERSKMIRDAVAKAKKDFVGIRRAMRVATLTTGEIVFTKPKRSARLSSFEVPISYIDKCLNVEEPISDELLPIMKDAFTRVHKDNDPEGLWDLRTYNPETDGEGGGQSFDQFIANYRQHGARYAWSENWMGGDGKNPSLNFLWNGTHSGYHAFQHGRVKQEALIADLKKVGFVGLAYDGGVRTTGSGAHGGGGHRHNAYVFWNEDDVASFRVGNDTVTDPELTDVSKGMRANKIYR